MGAAAVSARSRLTRKRAPNGTLRYLNKRERQEPRTKHFRSGNRSWGREPEADR